jgi:hypothetical protein
MCTSEKKYRILLLCNGYTLSIVRNSHYTLVEECTIKEFEFFNWPR